MDVFLGAAPRRGDPGLERRVGPARGVDLGVRRPPAEQRVGRGEEHGEGQVDPHRRGERREDHRVTRSAAAPAAKAKAKAREAPRRFLGPEGREGDRFLRRGGARWSV